MPTFSTSTSPTGQVTSGMANPFGSIPQQIAMPGSLYSEAMGANPTLGPLGAQTSGAIGSQLSGNLSPGTIRMLTDKAADYGVSSGMPGMTPGSLALNNLMNNMGITSESLTQQGIGNYGNLLQTTANTQLDPSLNADVSEWNSVMKAAPNPADAANYQMSLLDKYLAAFKTPMGGFGAFAGGAGGGGPWWAGSGLAGSLGPGTQRTGPNTFSTPHVNLVG